MNYDNIYTQLYTHMGLHGNIIDRWGVFQEATLDTRGYNQGTMIAGSHSLNKSPASLEIFPHI